jgi:hypothetical protein
MANATAVGFLNYGTKCGVRLATAAYTLRKHFSGKVYLLAQGDQPKWLQGVARWLQMEVFPLGVPPDQSPLLTKNQLYRVGPKATSLLFLDADTTVEAPIDSFFSLIEPHGFCATRFVDWRSSGRIIGGRIKAFSKICSKETIEKALAFGPAINTGVFGYAPGAAISEPLELLTKRAFETRVALSPRIPDEVACQILLPQYPHTLAGPEWNMSCRYGEISPELKIIHFHGRKHVGAKNPLSPIWLRNYHDMLREAPSDLKPYLTEGHGDKAIKWAKSAVNAVTVVAAVDPNYVDQLRSNWPAMIKVPGISDKPWLVFVNGMPLDDKRLDFLDNRARRVEWNPKWHGATQREIMLSSFVLGAAEHVQTPYFLKIDTDVVPEADAAFDPPKAAWNSVLTGHPWHYTKPGEWLKTLEAWGDKALPNTQRLFSKAELTQAEKEHRYGHDRIASFVCLHKTAFVKECAALCSGRMPVPSHDTFLWYCARRMDKTICRHNMKKMGFRP